MDKDDLDFDKWISGFANPSLSSHQESLQNLLVAVFFMTLGLLLIGAGLISLLLRLWVIFRLPCVWLSLRVKHICGVFNGHRRAPKLW